MFSKNNISYPKNRGIGSSGPPKAGNRMPELVSRTRIDVFPRESTTVNVDKERNAYFPAENDYYFTRDLAEKTVKKFLFILGGEEKFEKLTLRNKITMLIKKSHIDFQDWHFEQEANETPPKTWNEFKNEVI
ncbi:hypothetical protein H311_02178 [Anncaliia algerae PRA109]|nr:hypothetical protein H311_02178 [Anncaliia algerae PRA109]